MDIVAVFLIRVFVYNLLSRRLESTAITAPIVFTTAGLLLGFVLPVASG